MNKQEIFNKVASHLLTQKATSSVTTEFGDYSCMYRIKGTKLSCAVGCLIPDELYSEEQEGNTVSSLIACYPKIAEHLDVQTAADIDFLDSLQMLHDRNKPEIWPEILTALAVQYELDCSVLDSFKSV